MRRPMVLVLVACVLALALPPANADDAAKEKPAETPQKPARPAQGARPSPQRCAA